MIYVGLVYRVHVCILDLSEVSISLCFDGGQFMEIYSVKGAQTKTQTVYVWHSLASLMQIFFIRFGDGDRVCICERNQSRMLNSSLVNALE